MGYGGGCHATVVDKGRRASNRNTDRRKKRAQIKLNGGAKDDLRPIGRDAKKQQIIDKRLRNMKKANENKKATLPKGVKASDLTAMVVEDAAAATEGSASK